MCLNAWGGFCCRRWMKCRCLQLADGNYIVGYASRRMIGEDLLVDVGAHHRWRIAQTSWWEPKTGMGWIEPNTGIHIHIHTHTPTYGVEGAGLHVAHPVKIESEYILESHQYNILLV